MSRYGCAKTVVGPVQFSAVFCSDWMSLGVVLDLGDDKVWVSLGPFQLMAYWGAYKQYRPVTPQRIKDARRLAIGRIFVEKLTANDGKVGDNQ